MERCAPAIRPPESCERRQKHAAAAAAAEGRSGGGGGEHSVAADTHGPLLCCSLGTAALHAARYASRSAVEKRMLLPISEIPKETLW